MDEQKTQEGQTTNNQPTVTPAPKADGEQNKLLAVLGYIIPILFFLPLVTGNKDNKFAMFHANQHLLLLIIWVAGSFLLRVFFIGYIVNLIGIVLMIMGIISAAKGEMKPLPVIGSINILYKD